MAADVIGKVSEIYVERGSRVRAGAPLIRLDRRQAELVDAEARSAAAAVESQAALAQAECVRAEKLFADGAINQADFDRSKTQCESAALNAHAARARRQMAGKSLGDLVIKAPFAGIVADRFVNVGEYVRAETKVATVVQLTPLRLELSVPEQALSAFGVGADVAFKVAAWPNQTFTGKVRFIGATVRRATRDLLVDAVVENKDERLRPGMFAVAEVKLGVVDAAGGAQGRPAHRRAGRHRSPVHRQRRPGGGAPGAHRAGGGRADRHPDRRQGGRADRARARQRHPRRPEGPVAVADSTIHRFLIAEETLPCNG